MISVIVPVYNVENYIDECIMSILGQTFKDFELLLIVDGCTDSSRERCESYIPLDSRVRVIWQDNNGVSYARNVGIASSHGEYLTFIDSDDIVNPFYLEHLYHGVIAHSAEMCMCWFRKFSDSVPKFENQQYTEKRIITGREACYYIDAQENRVSTTPCMKLYKRSLFENILYPVGRIHEDEAITHQLLYNAKTIVELDECLYYYRDTPNSIMTSSFSIRRYDAVIALEERCVFFAVKNEAELARKAKQSAELIKAKYSIRARNSGIYDQVPPEYRMSTLRALAVIHKYSDPDNFEWFLSLVSPKLVKPYEYLRKIITILKK